MMTLDGGRKEAVEVWHESRTSAMNKRPKGSKRSPIGAASSNGLAPR